MMIIEFSLHRDLGAGLHLLLGLVNRDGDALPVEMRRDAPPRQVA
jgi:hypothetical protein